MAGGSVQPIRWGGRGPLLHLAHANGFPPGTYRRLIEALAQRFVVLWGPTLPLRSGTDPAAVGGWEDLARDLGTGLLGAGVHGAVGVGHSLGAVISLMAAAERPRLFRALVLLDPVLFAGTRAWLWGWTKRLGLAKRFRLARGAARRRERWPSREAAREAWRGRPVFAAWAPGVLEDYVQAALVPSGYGFRLLYPRAWEARLFTLTPHDPWPWVRRVQVPVLALRGARSDTFLPGAAEKLVRVAPQAAVEEVPGTGHFLPMERPVEVARRIVEFVDRLAALPPARVVM